MKTIGTVPHAGVHARVPRQKILLLSMALTCGGLPTQRSFRLAALSFLLSFCYRFGAWCNLDLFKDSALKNGRWFTLCLSSRDCSFGGPGDTPCCSLCEDISLKPQIETCQGISTTIIGGYRFFFFLIVLQWFADAPRKTDMRILIPWVGDFYNLSLGLCKGRMTQNTAKHRWQNKDSK